jgi:hypothetical protein
MVTIHLPTKFYISNFSAPLATATTLTAEEKFSSPAIYLFYIVQNPAIMNVEFATGG